MKNLLLFTLVIINIDLHSQPINNSISNSNCFFSQFGTTNINQEKTTVNIPFFINQKGSAGDVSINVGTYELEINKATKYHFKDKIRNQVKGLSKKELKNINYSNNPQLMIYQLIPFLNNQQKTKLKEFINRYLDYSSEHKPILLTDIENFHRDFTKFPNSPSYYKFLKDSIPITFNDNELIDEKSFLPIKLSEYLKRFHMKDIVFDVIQQSPEGNQAANRNDRVIIVCNRSEIINGKKYYDAKVSFECRNIFKDESRNEITSIVIERIIVNDYDIFSFIGENNKLDFFSAGVDIVHRMDYATKAEEIGLKASYPVYVGFNGNIGARFLGIKVIRDFQFDFGTGILWSYPNRWDINSNAKFPVEGQNLKTTFGESKVYHFKLGARYFFCKRKIQKRKEALDSSKYVKLSYKPSFEPYLILEVYRNYYRINGETDNTEPINVNFESYSFSAGIGFSFFLKESHKYKYHPINIELSALTRQNNQLNDFGSSLSFQLAIGYKFHF